MYPYLLNTGTNAKVVVMWILGIYQSRWHGNALDGKGMWRTPKHIKDYVKNTKKWMWETSRIRKRWQWEHKLYEKNGNVLDIDKVGKSA